MRSLSQSLSRHFMDEVCSLFPILARPIWLMNLCYESRASLFTIFSFNFSEATETSRSAKKLWNPFAALPGLTGEGLKVKLLSCLILRKVRSCSRSTLRFIYAALFDYRQFEDDGIVSLSHLYMLPLQRTEKMSREGALELLSFLLFWLQGLQVFCSNSCASKLNYLVCVIKHFFRSKILYWNRAALLLLLLKKILWLKLGSFCAPFLMSNCLRFLCALQHKLCNKLHFWNVFIKNPVFRYSTSFSAENVVLVVSPFDANGKVRLNFTTLSWARSTGWAVWTMKN